MGEYGPVVETVTFSNDATSMVGGYTLSMGASYQSPTRTPPKGSWDDGDAEAALAGAIQAHIGGPLSGLRYKYSRSLQGIPTNEYYSAEYGRILFVGHADEIVPPDPSPTLPPGATSWEWDYSTQQVIGATLRVRANGRMMDGTVSPPEARIVTPYPGGTYHLFEPATGVTWDTSWGRFPQTWDGGALGSHVAHVNIPMAVPPADQYDEYDVLPYIENPDNTDHSAAMGRIALSVRVRHGGVLHPLDPSDDGSISAGGVNAGMVYTITRGYRFWYPDGVPGPPRVAVTRLYPRDDARGLSSAARIHPPTKARRIVGGYQ